MANIKVRVGQQPAVKVLTTGAISGGGSNSLESLTDTDISNKIDGQLLIYENSSGKWKNSSTVLEANVDGGVY